MRPELEKILYTKYPELFKQKDLPMTQTCMCWGIEPADGWFDIIDALCFSIMAYCEVNSKEVPQFCQIKEKFGLLRIYMDHSDSYIEGLVDIAEEASSKVCELCGISDSTVTTEGGWLTTQCKACRDKKAEKDLWPQG